MVANVSGFVQKALQLKKKKSKSFQVKKINLPILRIDSSSFVK